MKATRDTASQRPFTHRLAALAAAAWLLAGLGMGCDSSPAEHDRSCTIDSDCKVIDSCCECAAVNQSAVANECESVCAVAGCHHIYGDNTRVARCVAGTCEHAPSDGGGGSGGSGGSTSTSGSGGG